MSESDISKMKVADLKRELKNKGLSTVGNKNDLIERLLNASNEGEGGKDNWLLDDPLDHDDLLDDDELDEKELLDDHEDELLNPSPDSKTQAPVPPANPPNSSNSSTEPKPVHKKVSLKRNLSIPAPPVLDVKVDVAEAENNETLSAESTEPSKKIAKITALTAEERQKIRAEKFGTAAGGTTTSGVDDKKLARAARFGIQAGDTSKISDSATSADIDTLKKRAERFGTTTATQLNKVEQEEKLKKRQERFGIVVPSSTTATKTDYSEKAKQRLERFKTAA